MKKIRSRLSIIIPTFNSGETLEIALKSIVEQTFSQIEILIIDGLSTDNTLKIAKEYQHHFPYIKIISEADRGVYDAMNKGIGLACGEWIYFLGSDDYLYRPSTIQNFMKIEGLQKLDVVYGDVYRTKIKGRYDGEFTYSKLEQKNICHQAIFFRKKVFNITGNFNLRYQVLADWDHNIKWFFSSKVKFQYVDQVFATFTHGGLSSSKKDYIFLRDKNRKFLLLGIGKLPLYRMIRIHERLIDEYEKEGKNIIVILLKASRFHLRVWNRLGKEFYKK